MSEIKPQAVPKPKKERTTFSVRFDDASRGSLLLVARRRGDGTAQTFAVHTTKDAKGKAQNVRGATEQHPSIEAARTAQEKLGAKAVALGWKRREAFRGFAAKPDAFDAGHLPAPAKATKKVA